MHITYPHLEILLAYIDILSCICFLWIFAELVRAFGFIIGPLFYTATAMAFGSVAPASSWEPFWVVIAALAMSYFCQTGAVQKYKHFLDLVIWDQPQS